MSAPSSQSPPGALPTPGPAPRAPLPGGLGDARSHLAPTRRDAPRPASPPAGWRCTCCPDGSEQWTWTSSDGVPLASVLVSPHGELSPPMMRDPYHYWMSAAGMRRCAQALDQLALHVGRSDVTAVAVRLAMRAPCEASFRVSRVLRDPKLRLRRGERLAWRFLR